MVDGSSRQELRVWKLSSRRDHILGDAGCRWDDALRLGGLWTGRTGRVGQVGQVGTWQRDSEGRRLRAHWAVGGRMFEDAERGALMEAGRGALNAGRVQAGPACLAPKACTPYAPCKCHRDARQGARLSFETGARPAAMLPGLG